jgi:hypothetical protein
VEALETAKAAWSPRAYHQAVVLNDKIYVLGGGNYVPSYHAKNDVWSSSDGVNWTCETESAPWGPRLWFSAAVYRGRIWVVGGWSKEKDNFGDVWHSADGKNWQRLDTKTGWKARHEHSSVRFSGQALARRWSCAAALERSVVAELTKGLATRDHSSSSYSSRAIGLGSRNANDSPGGGREANPWQSEHDLVASRHSV